MIETKVEVPGIAAEAFFFRPDDIADFPAVLFLTDIWGVRPANIGMAKRLAAEGFAVLMPNVVHRFGPNQPNGFETDDEGENKRRLGQLFASLTPDQMQSDGTVYVEFLLAQKGVKSAGTSALGANKVGVVGYCFTGQMALRVAAAIPDTVVAAASFHGGFLVTDCPDSPHKLLPQIKARLYFGHAVEDQSMTPQQIEILEAALRDWHGAFESETYQGARHGWTVPGRPVYNELQAERAFENLMEMFDATLE
jgi:carboxymethylenebutenolidase